MSTTIKAIAATEKATKSLSGVAASILKVLSDFPTAVEAHNEVVYNIEVAQNELDLIVEQTEAAQRKSAAELKLLVLEDEDSVLGNLLAARNLATITNEKLDALNSDLNDALADNQSDINKAVSIAVAAEKAAGSSALSAANSAHSIAVAQNEADIKASAVQIKFMNEQITSLKETINDERTARVAMAESASKASGVTVNAGKQ